MLSGEDVRNILSFDPSKSVNILRYPDFSQYHSILDLIPNSKNWAIVILYPFEVDGRAGHWCCLSDDKNGVLTFFDSFGEMIDGHALSAFQYPLKKLLLDYIDDGHNVEYNSLALQSESKGVNTCGRWICCWLLCSTNMTVDEFGRSVEQICHEYYISPDEFVVKLSDWFAK